MSSDSGIPYPGQPQRARRALIEEPATDALADFNPPEQLVPPTVWQGGSFASDFAVPPPVLPAANVDPDESEPTVRVGGYGRRLAADEAPVSPYPAAPPVAPYPAASPAAPPPPPAPESVPPVAPEYRPYRQYPPVESYQPDVAAEYPPDIRPLEPPHPKEPPRPKFVAAGPQAGDKPVAEATTPADTLGAGDAVGDTARSAAATGDKAGQQGVDKRSDKDDKKPDKSGESDQSDTAAEFKSAKTRPRWKGWLIDLAVIIVGAMVLTSVLRLFVYQAFNVPTGSMEQTLRKQDSIVAVKLLDFERGDIVVFEDSFNWLRSTGEEQPGPVRRALEFIGLLPSTTTQHLVKRVIGLPGDRVVCCDASTGSLMVNGVALDESEYLYSVGGTPVSPSTITFDVIVPKDRIFVMGDHRNDSSDSRFHLCDIPNETGTPRGMTAFIPIEDVVGKVVAISSPWSHMRWFSTPKAFDNVPAPGPAPDTPTIKTSQC
ncbi:MAG: signal peptidase I [Propionibacteriaceae bacterium]|nr:signal peptidase I [Propionibacteriaceae bacterium]